ncbi:tigger transposable element-derived protein 1-like isoform X2 [Hemicordylus capensis]|uniref:tigger transposable element-derived protein 1-like isoform X2 n=1 Tax=Hemicordylus capensis TaxID=884348 RepID=UPI002303C2DA|nr:tigger transposable element-derived protein 1-like isoform X2 [Hemicordylus capensis]
MRPDTHKMLEEPATQIKLEQELSVQNILEEKLSTQNKLEEDPSIQSMLEEEPVIQSKQEEEPRIQNMLEEKQPTQIKLEEEMSFQNILEEEPPTLIKLEEEPSLQSMLEEEPATQIKQEEESSVQNMLEQKLPAQIKLEEEQFVQNMLEEPTTQIKLEEEQFVHSMLEEELSSQIKLEEEPYVLNMLEEEPATQIKLEEDLSIHIKLEDELSTLFKQEEETSMQIKLEDESSVQNMVEEESFVQVKLEEEPSVQDFQYCEEGRGREEEVRQRELEERKREGEKRRKEREREGSRSERERVKKMAPKRVRKGEEGAVAKRPRHVMSLGDKIKVLDCLREGQSSSMVGRLFGVSESTIRNIKKTEAAIRVSVANGTPSSRKVSYMPRDPNIEKTEKALNIWMEDQTQKKFPLSARMICNKARKIYRHLVESSGEGDPEKFQASKGWFENFKKRFSLHNVKLSGEIASADQQAAATFPAELKRLIQERGYVPDQVFNADETTLFWKRMPDRTFIAKEERRAPGFKAAKDRLTLLFCSNTSGGLMVKPMLVYRSLNPRALKGKNKNHLPVFWRANVKAWVTRTIFMSWFNDCFVHEVERYLREKNLVFKALLLLDNAPGHPPDLLLAHPNVEVVFLPPNTASLIQPLEQGIIQAFKRYYSRRNFEHIADLMDSNPDLTLKEAWKGYNITHALTIIKEAMDEIKASTLNACWRKLWKEAVKDPSAVPAVEEEVGRIVTSARRLGGEGFEDIQPTEVAELLESHSEELTEQDLEALIKSSSDQEEEEDCRATAKLILGKVNRFLKHASKLADEAVDMDPFIQGSLTFRQGLNELICPYAEVQKDLRKMMAQPTLLNFFKGVHREQSGTSEQPGTSGSSCRLLATVDTEEEEEEKEEGVGEPSSL